MVRECELLATGEETEYCPRCGNEEACEEMMERDDMTRVCIACWDDLEGENEEPLVIEPSDYQTMCVDCDQVIPAGSTVGYTSNNGKLEAHCDDCSDNVCEGYDKGCGCGGCMGKDNAPSEHDCTNGGTEDPCDDCHPDLQ